MRKNFLKRNLCCLISSLCLTAHTAVAGDLDISYGKWQITFDESSKTVTYVYQDLTLLKKVFVQAVNANGEELKSNDYPNATLKKESISDVFGDGEKYTYIYSGLSGKESLEQVFYFYPSQDYLLTEAFLVSDQQSSCNWIAPIMTKTSSTFLPAEGDNRLLYVPFDNDSFRGYSANPWGISSTSCEVTAIYDVISRQGLCLGSIEHDNWKTGISIGKGDRDNIGSLVCYGGIADEQTRDVKAHGALAGKKIKSPKVFLGFFEDWCDGLEAYAKANAVIAPPKAWEKAVPFGWNSWGALQFNLTYEKAMEVSDYFKENLQNNHFVNPDQTVYIGLDSGWDCMNEEQLKSFIEKCKSNGQIGGIYWTPFTDWARDPERTVDAAPEYKYKDIYLYANGKPQELDGAYAVDPTHPAVEAMMKKTSGLFHRAGFEYVKMDFMTHGAMEADKWYNPEITTGIQGYNYGMKLLNQYFGDMYINLSISPVFPAQYAQSRRIACDAWNQIKDTEYTLNALSYGWWQKYIYQYNDADHIVLRDATDGENRARITSGVITGIYITGDDFSAGGGKDAKEKSQKYLTNAAVNAVATGEVFRPVEGNGEKPEHIFVRKTPDGRFHCAVFNYSDQEQTTVLSLERIGLDKARGYQVKELWSGNETFATGQLEVTVPSKDVQLLEFK